MLPPIIHLSKAKDGYGGKALGLAKLFEYGAPVPEGVALSPEFVQDIVQSPDKKSNHVILTSIIRAEGACRFAVRSSALSEDGEKNSFAGIYDTVLNVNANPYDLVDAVSKVSKGQTSSRALFYKAEKGIVANEKAQLGIVIQEMIDPVIAGVAFTAALGANGQSIMLLECGQGLGDKLVSGEITPTRIEIPLSNGEVDISRAVVTGTPLNMAGLDRLVSAIAQVKRAAKKDLDIEWAIDKEGRPWLLQARPITKAVLAPALTATQSVPASSGLAKGTAFVVNSTADLPSFPEGAILVAEVTDTNFLPALQRAAAIITEEGGILSHAAIVAREMGIPCVVGYSGARRFFPTGVALRVDGTSGIVHNETAPHSVNTNLAKQAVDWGAAYLFENIIPVQVKGVTGLINPTPAGLALHLPEDIAPEVDEQFEIFSRKTFGTSPKRYQSDKYLWYFEWERFQENPFFRSNLQKSIDVVAMLDSRSLVEHYDSVVEHSKQLASGAQDSHDAAVNFFFDETLLTSHFLLTMLIPEGYAIKTMYTKSQPLLEERDMSFSDLLSGVRCIQESNQELEKIADFSQSLSQLRNSIYGRLLQENIMRNEYFDDRNERAVRAVTAMGIEYSPGQDPVSVFYANIRQVSAFASLSNFVLTQKNSKSA